MSFTHEWPSEGLQGLRDLPPEQLADIFNAENLEPAYYSAMTEYFAHGNVRKAAEVTRALTKLEPLLVNYINEKFDPVNAKKLLKTKLDYLPASASDYPRHLIEYIQ